MEKLIEKMKTELKIAVEQHRKITVEMPTNLPEQCRLLGVVETLRNTIHWAELEMIRQKYQ